MHSKIQCSKHNSRFIIPSHGRRTDDIMNAPKAEPYKSALYASDAIAEGAGIFFFLIIKSELIFPVADETELDKDAPMNVSIIIRMTDTK